MHKKPQWFLIETEQEYNNAIVRYEEIKHVTAKEEYQEKLLLMHVIENL